MASSRFKGALATILAFALLSFSIPLDVLARSAGGYSGGRSSSYASGKSSARGYSGSHTSTGHSTIKCESRPRDSHARIKRDPKAVEDFKHTHPKPPGCSGCEVDQIVPLSKGGRDNQGNMQWLPRELHLDKTKRDLAP